MNLQFIGGVEKDPGLDKASGVYVALWVKFKAAHKGTAIRKIAVGDHHIYDSR